MSIAPIDASPAQVIGEPGGIGAFDEALELLEVFAVEFVRRAKVDGNSVLDDTVLFQD